MFKLQSESKSLPLIQNPVSSSVSSASPDFHCVSGTLCWFNMLFVMRSDFHGVWGMSCWFTMLFMLLIMDFVPCSFISSFSTIEHFKAHLKCQGNPDPLRPVQHCEHKKYIQDGNDSVKTPIMVRSPDWLLRLNWRVSAVFFSVSDIGFSVAAAQSWHFAILVNKLSKISKIFEQLDHL